MTKLSKLSERILYSEAAPWVINEVKSLEEKYELSVLHSNIYYQQIEWLEEQNRKMLEALKSFTAINDAMGHDWMLSGNIRIPESWFKCLSLAKAAIAAAEGETK